MKASVSRGAGFAGLLAYASDQSKRAEIISSNMSSSSADDLASEFGSIRSLRREVAKPVWHCSLSLPPGDALDKEQWDLVIRDHLANLGIDPDNHQFVSYVHHDKNHQHVHIVANRIGLDGRIWLGQFEAMRAIESTQTLEKKHGLTLTVGLQGDGNRPLTRAERAMRDRTGELPIRQKIKEIIDNAPKSNLQDFAIYLKSNAVTIIPSGTAGTPQGASFEMDGQPIKGSSIGKKYAWSKLSKQLSVTAADLPLIDELRHAVAETSEKIELVTAAEIADALLKDVFGRASNASRDVLDDLLGEVEEPQRDTVRQLINLNLVKIGEDERGMPIVTTREILERESQLVADAKFLTDDRRHDLSDAEIAAAIYKKEVEASLKFGKPIRMTLEQREAVAHGLRGGLAITQGSAGAGKSFSAEAIKIAYQGKGYSVLGAAVSKKAAMVLEAETGIKSCTIAKLIKDIGEGTVKLNSKTCLVLDEAGLLSSSQWSTLVAATRAAGAKILATGEDRQLDAIQHGGALRYLSRSDVVGAARIETVVRQDEQWARDMVMDFRDGRVAEAVAALAERGLVNFIDDDEDGEAIDALVADWKSFEDVNPDKGSLIIAHRNADVRILGERVRAIRKQEGRVSGADHLFEAAHGDNKFKLVLANGDRVRLNKNNQELDIANGDTATLLSITKTPDGADYELVLNLDRGGVRTVFASQYRNEDGRLQMSNGYAMTVYSAQGTTISGDVFVLQSRGMDRANSYVAASRAKGNTRLYVNQSEIKDQSALVKLSSRDVVQPLAVEIREKMENENEHQTISHISTSEPANSGNSASVETANGVRVSELKKGTSQPERVRPATRTAPTRTTTPASVNTVAVDTISSVGNVTHIPHGRGSPTQANQTSTLGVAELDGAAQVALKQLQRLIASHPNPKQAIRNMWSDGYTKASVTAAAKAAGLTVDVDKEYRKMREERAELEQQEMREQHRQPAP